MLTGKSFVCDENALKTMQGIKDRTDLVSDEAVLSVALSVLDDMSRGRQPSLATAETSVQVQAVETSGPKP